MHFDEEPNAKYQRLGTLGMLCSPCARDNCLGGPPEAASLALRPSLLVVYSHSYSTSVVLLVPCVRGYL